MPSAALSALRGIAHVITRSLKHGKCGSDFAPAPISLSQVWEWYARCSRGVDNRHWPEQLGMPRRRTRRQPDFRKSRLGAASGGIFFHRLRSSRTRECTPLPLLLNPAKSAGCKGAALGYNTTGGLLTRPLLLYANAVEVLGRADKKRVIPDRIGGQGFLIQRIFRNFEKLFSGFENNPFALLALEVNLAVGIDWGRGVVPADSFLPMHLPGARIDAARDSGIGDHVEFVA